MSVKDIVALNHAVVKLKIPARLFALLFLSDIAHGDPSHYGSFILSTLDSLFPVCAL